MKDRIIYLDYVRIIACLMVLMMHAPMPGELASQHGPFLSGYSFLTYPCVPLFFMVSGALLLPCNPQIPTGKYLRKRLIHVVVPTLVFTTLYIILNLDGTDKGLTRTIFSIPFSVQGTGILWFIYPLIGLYLLTPIISPWLRTASKRTLQLYLLIWAVTLLYPFLVRWLDINESPKGILFYFSGYAGFFLLGYYMNKYPVSMKLFVPLAILMPVYQFANKYFGFGFSFEDLYLNLPVAIMTIAWFGMIKYLCRNCKNESPKIVKLSTLTFGVYLIHPLIMRAWIWNWPMIGQMSNYYLQTFAVVGLTALLSFFAAWLISKLPFSKYVIGV